MHDKQKSANSRTISRTLHIQDYFFTVTIFVTMKITVYEVVILLNMYCCQAAIFYQWVIFFSMISQSKFSFQLLLHRITRNVNFLLRKPSFTKYFPLLLTSIKRKPSFVELSPKKTLMIALMIWYYYCVLRTEKLRT